MLTRGEIDLWIAKYQIDPYSAQRADLRSAMVASLLANIFSGKSKKFKISEFMPTFGPKPQQTDQQMEATARRWASAAGNVY
jgi:hypothetical protein